MDESVRAFLQQHHAAAMITLRADGTPHAARVAVALVGDQLQSSGNQGRLRTRFLRRDPRCTLFVFPETGGQYLTLETRVTILEGDDVPDRSVELFQVMQPNAAAGTLNWAGKAMSIDEFKQAMRDDNRLIYEFEIDRAYGSYA
jgi:PPOX class probable F420-dependent enzyme